MGATLGIILCDLLYRNVQPHFTILFQELLQIYNFLVR